MYDVSAAEATYSGPDILAVLLLGIVGGIFGSIYNYLVDKVIRTYSIIHEYVLIAQFSHLDNDSLVTTIFVADIITFVACLPLLLNFLVFLNLQKGRCSENLTCYHHCPLDIIRFLWLAMVCNVHPMPY